MESRILRSHHICSMDVERDESCHSSRSPHFVQSRIPEFVFPSRLTQSGSSLIDMPKVCFCVNFHMKLTVGINHHATTCFINDPREASSSHMIQF